MVTSSAHRRCESIRKPARRSAFTLVELLVVIGIITLLISILVPVLASARERANRVSCSARLRGIGEMMKIYAHDNKGHYPRTQTSGGAFPRCFSGFDNLPFAVNHSNADNDVTGSYFLLIHYGLLKPVHFICPSTDMVPDPLGGKHPSVLCNFSQTMPLGKHLSYSLATPFAGKGSFSPKETDYKFTVSAPATLALAADRNDGEDRWATTDPDAPQALLRKINSTNHGRVGQNVLFNDGSVQFHTNPFAGHDRDNIYTTTVQKGAKGGFPGHRHDTILHPALPMKNSIE